MKIFAFFAAMMFMLMTPAQAQSSNTIDNAYTLAKAAGESAEKFFASLPQASGDYQSNRRPILIEGALNTEIEILVRALKNPVVYRELNWLFVAGTYGNYPVVVARTEQGIANAAASTALAIAKFKPVAVINQGTSGGHDSALKVGDIVVGASSFESSAYKTPYVPKGANINLTAQELLGTYAYDETARAFRPHKEFFADPTLFNMAFAAANSHGGFNVVSGKIATSDIWLNDINQINFLHEKYGSSCEEMETNAAAQICHTANVPFLGIRVISNNITVSDEYSVESATTVQNFVLLVAEHYIRNILKACQ